MRIRIYCEIENNEQCQRLIFENTDTVWYSGKNKEILKITSYLGHKYIIFYIEPEPDGMSYDACGVIRVEVDAVYWKKLFKKAFREDKLKRILKNEIT